MSCPPDDALPASKASDTGTLHFAVDAGLLFQLGEELVTHRSVALAELIKNAYDADATQVLVDFDHVQDKSGNITVTDDGSGMTFLQIEAAWMRIATPGKLKEPQSAKYGRARTGAKGVGRFAARRLARRLVLVSVAYIDTRRPALGREETTVDFRWADFESGAEVQAIPVRYRRRSLRGSPGKGATGTTLKLIGVRDVWLEEDLRSLMQDLARLVAPSHPTSDSSGDEESSTHSADPGIRIRIEAPEFPDMSGDVREQSLAGALAILDGRLGRDGTATYTVRFRRPKRKLVFEPKTRFRNVGAVRFRIHFFVYKKDYFAGLDLNVRDAARRGRDEGGIHLYVDRFRVAPYGDPGDDWLKLDEDRGRRLVNTPKDLARFAGKADRPMLFLPGNNQLFGQVHLSRRANPDIRQTLNRERVIDTPAFRELRSFVRKGIDYLTVAYAREYEAARKEKKSGRTDAGSLIVRARHQFLVASESMPLEQRSQILQAIDLAADAIHTQREDFISELSMLRVLASTGTMLVVFEHQLLGTLNGLRESHRALDALLPRVPPKRRRSFAAELARLDTWIASAKHQGELLGLLIARKARARRRRLALRPIVESMARAFASYATDNDIDLRNDVAATVRTPPMFEAELSAILINLLTNAFKAVRERPVRHVSVAADHTNHQLVIRVSDTGVGAAPGRWEDFFLPFVGESEPDPILGEGTGLGLKIVRDFASVYGGKARFVKPEPPWRTTVEVLLPEE
jgi:signal transduction histidine kinase